MVQLSPFYLNREGIYNMPSSVEIKMGSFSLISLIDRSLDDGSWIAPTLYSTCKWN
jgi:hypothetical protein